MELFSTAIFHALKDVSLPELQIYMTPMIIDENLTNQAEETTPIFERRKENLARGRKVAVRDTNRYKPDEPKSLGSVRLKA